MSVLQWNLRSIKSNYDNLKLFSTTQDSDIILLQETKLKALETIHLEGYKCFCRNVITIGNQIAHGGVAILVKEHIQCSRVQLDTNIQAVAVKINFAKPIIFCSIYIQEIDNISVQQFQNLLNQLGDYYILGGDLNGHNPMWNHDNYNNIGMVIEEIINKNGLYLLNDDEATHFNKQKNSWSTLDLTLASSSELTSHNWNVYYDLGNSDHLPIIFKILPSAKETFKGEQKFQENKADWTEFYKKSSSIAEATTIQEFNNCILKIAEKTIPKNSLKHHRKVVAWWTEEIASIVKERKKALRKFRRNENLLNLIELNRITAKSKLLIKKAVKNEEEKFCSSICPSTPIKTIFNNFKKLQGNFIPKNIQMLKVNGNIIIDNKEIANVMVEHFSSVSSDLNYDRTFQINKIQTEMTNLIIPETEDEINSNFTIQELDFALSKCKGKSVGISNISYNMLKHLHPCAKFTLLKIYNNI